MRLAVRTEELRSAAAALQESADEIGRLGAGLRVQRPGVGAWTLGPARTQADAFFATLSEGVAAAAGGLDDLALRTTVAASDYEDAEASALPGLR